MRVLKRIEEIAVNEGITMTALEKKISASKGVLTRASRNNTDIQLKWLTAIFDKYPQYSANWALTGKGEMLLTAIPAKEEGKSELKEPKVNAELELLRKLADTNETLIKKQEQEIEVLKDKISALQKKISS